MTPEMVLTAAQEGLVVTLTVCLVLLIPALVAGLLISMFQAATQINEMTLSFIPKLIVTFITTLLAAPWLISMVTDYTRRVFESIPYMIS